MAKRYCEVVEPGYYFIDNEYEKRCYYLTGERKGNKWIELQVSSPKWMSLAWTSIEADMLRNSTYYKNNPLNMGMDREENKY
jgi:hypothetical protein